MYDDVVHCPRDKETPTNTAAPDNDDHKDVCDGRQDVDSHECPNSHTYAVLEGPVHVSPFQRHKTKSVGVRKIRSPNIAKRLSDTAHVYDTLAEKARHTPASASTDDNPSVNQYAVLEGPTPVEHSDHMYEMKQVKQDSFKPNMHTRSRVSDTASSGYDKLPPKDMEDINIIQGKGESLSAAVNNKTTTLGAGYDRLDTKTETLANQMDMGHTYATLSPEEQSVKPKKGKKKSKKKQKQKQTSNQIDDNSHIYDILDLQSETNSCVGRDDHKMLPAAAPTSVSSSCGSHHSVNAPHKRKISHSFSSRTLCDVTEERKRALTVHTAASNISLHKIDPDSEAHIYDTVEVSQFPVSKRKQRCSGKKYRWLHLKERLQRQSSLDILSYPMDPNLTATTSHHMTKSGTKAKATLSASLGNVSEVVDSNLEPNSTYALLDMTQVYAQVGPYVPGKGGSEQQKPDNEKDSEYSHLQHH